MESEDGTDHVPDAPQAALDQVKAFHPNIPIITKLAYVSSAVDIPPKRIPYFMGHSGCQPAEDALAFAFCQPADRASRSRNAVTRSYSQSGGHTPCSPEATLRAARVLGCRPVPVSGAR